MPFSFYRPLYYSFFNLISTIVFCNKLNISFKLKNKMKKDKESILFTVIAGIILAIIFSASNASPGLRVGMTVSASISSAVVFTALMRIILKRKSIKENNIVQTIALAGEFLAVRVIFTIPEIRYLE